MDLNALFNEYSVKLVVMFVVLMLINYICDHREIKF